MKIIKYLKPSVLVFSLALIIFFSLFSGTARGLISANVTMSSQGSIIVNTNINLAPIPNGWLFYENSPCSFTANVHLDTNVTYNGAQSIRLDTHNSNDTNTNRECDNPGISVNAGDHIVFTCWIKTTASTMNPQYNNDLTVGKGERIGIDFYTYTDHWFVVGGVLINGYVKADGTAFPGLPLAEAAGSAVPWNTPTWTKQTIDCTIPSGYGITSIIPWLQALDVSDTALAWFAGSTLYINPA